VTGTANGGVTTSMVSGQESIMSSFVGGAGGSHLDDSEFASFPAIQEMLVSDAVVA
jgi:hypothetical protein